MNVLLLGIGIGLLTLIPPGPVSLTLVQLGARQGHAPAMRGALGVIGGDTLLGGVAVALVGVGAALPTKVFALSQVVAAALLVAIGVALLAKPDVATSSIDRIQRPGRALFLLTSFTPTALGAWIALLAAMPFAGEPSQLGLFAIGVVIASCLWHPTLGALASSLGARLNERGHSRLSPNRRDLHGPRRCRTCCPSAELTDLGASPESHTPLIDDEPRICEAYTALCAI